jgi:hypothetical protein
MFGLAGGLAIAFASGLAAGIMAGIVFGVVYGLDATEPDLTSNTGPVLLLSSDRRTLIAIWLSIGILAGAAAGLAVKALTGIVAGIVAGILTGLMLGLAAALLKTAWAYFAMAQAHLWVRRKVPRNLMAFLQDAHEHHGVLRRVGAVYQFRHIELQRHLAQQQT